MRRAVLKEAAKRFPWLANVTLYGCLFAGGDLAHQLIAQKERIDWRHTRDVAVVAITFHGNFNYFWLRALERRFPGKSAGMVFRKLLLDQSFASPLATSVFYTGKVNATQSHTHTRVHFGVCWRGDGGNGNEKKTKISNLHPAAFYQNLSTGDTSLTRKATQIIPDKLK